MTVMRRWISSSELKRVVTSKSKKKPPVQTNHPSGDRARRLRHRVAISDDSSPKCSAWSTAQEYYTADLLKALSSSLPGAKLQNLTLPSSGTQIWWIDNIGSRDKKGAKSVDETDTTLQGHMERVTQSIMESSESDDAGVDNVSRSYAEMPRAFVHDDGSMVFWNCSADLMTRVRKLAFCGGFEIGSYSSAIVESENEEMPFSVQEDSNLQVPRLQSGVIRFPSTLSDQDTILFQYTFSDSLSVSVKLAYWEIEVTHVMRSLESYILQMRDGRLDIDPQDIMRKLGQLYHINHKINLSSDFLDIPELYWEHPLLETAYLKMTSYLDVPKRVRVINMKMEQCFNLLEMLNSHQNHERSTRLEWIIIILIAIEVVFAFGTAGYAYMANRDKDAQPEQPKKSRRSVAMKFRDASSKQ